ncbi:S-adenosylmethionine decarboxylase [Pedobacter sp. JY14-1]|uniref:S-adenosylmethionine decarboxylase family protein n=1 Tax=Pedobacter sp. JY14-1 TaxID=3034151 RepID=UPI0023E2C9E9|nr:S-adenosylmethionine decarboxylase [Pedobacter sp. JY14-1]
MLYKPGLHILAEFTSDREALLSASELSKNLFDQLISAHGLQKVGEVYHDFEGGGFTGVVCLTESHLSIHTWPEFSLATFDVFLSNYRNENSEKVRQIYRDVLEFFSGVEIKCSELQR